MRVPLVSLLACAPAHAFLHPSYGPPRAPKLNSASSPHDGDISAHARLPEQAGRTNMEGSLWSRDSVFRLAQGSALGALALGLKAPMARADEDEDDEGVGTRPKTVEEYIDQIDKLNLRVADFPKGMEWIQSPPLSFSKELRGKVVLLDFFCYCCINCQHIVPFLGKLEEKYKGQAFEVVGVHSAKFQNEKDTANIREAITRYGIKHPVLNDKDMAYWSAVGATSWPTLALVSPKGTLLSIWAGEGFNDRIDAFVAGALEYYDKRGLLDATPLPKSAPQPSAQALASPLRYPGKVAVDPTGQTDRVFVSDSGNHRIVVLEKDGRFVTSVGSPVGESGFADGDFDSARFTSPQGLAVLDGGNTIYVADTNNHAIRKVDLVRKKVTTLVGNGDQGFDYSGGNSGKDQYLSSPWDVIPYSPQPDRPPSSLLVAMAGTHQIWQVDLATGRSSCFSGTGREKELNANNRIDAAWAQPSGLAMSQDGKQVFIADSESSTIREMSLVGKGPTRTLVGGSGVNPDNLFAFGDKDGKGASAKLQHPLGVAVVSSGVVVADSYNHRLKIVDVAGSSIKTIGGNGKPGYRDGKGSGVQFWEPGGLATSADGKVVYVADTNNNAIRTLDLATNEVTTLKVKDAPSTSEGGTQKQRSILNRRRARTVDVEPVSQASTVTIAVTLPEDCKFTNERPSLWQLVDNQGILRPGSVTTGTIEGLSTTITIDAVRDGVVEVESAVYFCEKTAGLCRTDGVVARVPVSSQGGKQAVTVDQVVVFKKEANKASY